MTTLILNGATILTTCDSATSDGAGGWVAYVDSKPLARYPASSGVTGIAAGVTLPSDYAPGAYSYSGGTFTHLADDPAALAAAISAKLQALNAYCFAKANGGTTVSGLPVETDVSTRTDLNGAYALAQADSSYTTNWVLAPGHAITLTAAQIIATAIAVGRFYGDCYNNQATHGAAIQALTTIAAVNAYDFTTGWPLGT